MHVSCTKINTIYIIIHGFLSNLADIQTVKGFRLSNVTFFADFVPEIPKL